MTTTATRLVVPDAAWADVTVDIGSCQMADALAPHLDGVPGVRVGHVSTGPVPLEETEVLIGYHFPEGSLARATRLRWLHLTGTGTDHLARTGLSEHCLVTTSARVPGEAVAEYAVAAVFTLAKHLDELGCCSRPEWYRSRATMIGRSTVAVVGTGRIGRGVLRRFTALGARTMAVTRRRGQLVTDADVSVALDQLHEHAGTIDHLVICLPGAEGCPPAIDRAVLDALPATATVTNVGRPDALDNDRLLDALRAGRLQGAFLDVHPGEPLPDDHPSYAVPGLVVSPHRAFGFPDEADTVIRVFRENLADLRAGRTPRDATTPTTSTTSTTRRNAS